MFSGSNGRYSSALPKPQYYSEPCPSSLALLLSSILALSSLSTNSTMTPFMSQLYHDATCLPDSITPISVQMPIPPSTISQVFKVPLHIPFISSIPSPIPEKSSVLSPSSLLATTMQVSSIETSIPDTPSTFEVTVIQSSNSSSLTSHVTMPMPSHTMMQTSSLISTGIDAPSIDEIRDEFNEDIVISLGDYHYRKSDKLVVKRGKKRSRDQNVVDTFLSNEIVWNQQSSDP